MTLELSAIRSTRKDMAVAVGAVAAAGAALRLAIADGPLGNDEVWSLANLARISRVPDIFWGISHDNNHFLNSLWLFFAWPLSHDPLWLRLPAILAGAATIAAMARLGARQGQIGALAAALLTAFSFFQITYSVQARGYAVATLALVLAYGALERALDDPRPPARVSLAVWAGLAFFSHFAAAPALALFGVVALLELLRRGARPMAALSGAFRLFWPVALAMAPTLACVVAGYIRMGGFTIGFLHAFGAWHTLMAYANLEMTTLGLDTASPTQAVFAVSGLPLLMIAATILWAPADRRIAYFVLLGGPLVAALALRVPNTHAARYFFASSPFLILLFSDLFASGWARGGPARAIASLALVAALCGDGAALLRLRTGLQEPYTAALDAITASGETAAASSFDFNVGRTLTFASLDRREPVSLAPRERICSDRPRWYIDELAGDQAGEREIIAKGEGCALTYDFVAVYSRFTPWQAAWALYRRKD